MLLLHRYKDASPSGEVTWFLPAFSGTPFVATKVDANFYHLILLPSDWSLDSQLDLVFRQARANRLPTFLVSQLGGALALYPKGLVEPVRVSPQDGLLIVQDKLAPAVEIPCTEELMARSRALEEYAWAQHKGGSATGDLLKGGRHATEEELAELGGLSESGVPRGLELCADCLEWRGHCIDPSPRLPSLLVRVYCSCENIHRCARCEELLCERRLCGNHWGPADQRIWYWPGFCGFRHRCGFLPD